ncbi:protein C3orf33 homolog isoform X2 [Alligator mississippiensis]|uniref:protein C3orf33 homolog isoform X2 n=1 Tax=Alligator mississippiensis TaxID=8496 RepID=UPI0007122709|nr:protein C3orf33 homolog isoform X2 [Alligator mississippiensis]
MPPPTPPVSAVHEMIRNISTGMAVAGIILFARSIKLTTKFTSALDIPVEFIEKNVKLRGRLRHITEKGLEVEHIPISLPFISSLQRKWQSNGLLLVRLAGVELMPSGMVWLQEELKPSQMMWFQLLGRDNLVLDCLVSINKSRFFSICLNEEVLKQGLGKTTRIEGLHHGSQLYWKLHKRFLRAELTAVKKNKGIWKERSNLEKIRDQISSNKFVQMLKQFADWLRSHI